MARTQQGGGGGAFLPITGGELDGQLIIDTDNVEALLVRADGDSGDVMAVDTITPGLVLADGTAADPIVRFAAEPNTGFARVGGGLVEWRMAGTQALRIFLNNLRIPAGSEATPGLLFLIDTDTGIYRASPDVLGFVTGGIESMRIDATQHVIFNRRYQGKQGANIASAADIVLGDGNLFRITGSTTINTISATGWQDGSLVRLVFDSTPTITHLGAGTGAQISLAGSVNYTPSGPNRTLTLVLEGGTWLEPTR